MKRATLLHNPTAGDNEFSKKELMKIIKKEGFECNYASVKDESWDDFDDDTDFLIIAGGDGTVRRVAKALMKRTMLQKQFPLALLPHGTANNVACSLEIVGHPKDIIERWHEHQIKPFDIGRIGGLGEPKFFLESFGHGIFPRLMKVLEKVEDEMGESAEEKLEAARLKLIELAEEYEARECTVVADGNERSGRFLMVEVMNIRSIGPNLILAPDADPGDGCLDVVLVPESDRGRFVSFLKDNEKGQDQDFGFTVIRAKKVKIKCDGKDIHADDERIKCDDAVKARIEIMPSMLRFIRGDE